MIRYMVLLQGENKMKQTREITFAQVCEVEPELWGLLREAREIYRNKPRFFNLDRVWFYKLKPKMVELVGVGANGWGMITSRDAYDVAYSELYNALKGRG